MSWRIASRGHNVTVYAPIKKTTKSPWRGVKWLRYEKANFKQPGIWILYRCPEVVDKFIPRKRTQQLWLLWQDWDYPTLTKRRIKAVDHHITLSKSHGRYMLANYPDIGNRLWLTSNGIKLDLIEEVEKENIKKNPYRIMYASSPDRGLKQGLLVFKKAKEYVPELEFHAFYGFNNLNKLLKGDKHSAMARNVAEIKELLKQPGVTFHGRINQKQLMREWFKSGIYLYCTNFFETSHISGMEAMACGAVPVFSPIFAQGENILHGIGVEGDSMSPLTQSRFAAEIIRLALDHKLQGQIRLESIPYARNKYYWETFADQWILEAQGKRKEFEKQYAFPSQL